MDNNTRKNNNAKSILIAIGAGFFGLLAFLGADFFVEVFNSVAGSTYNTPYTLIKGICVYIGKFPNRVIGSISWTIFISLALYSLFWLLIKFLKNRTIIRMVGLRAFLPRETVDSKAESWDDCRGHLKDPKNTEIMIMGANGWDTFADDDAPLRETIDNFTGRRVRVLLMHPQSQFIEERANLAREAPESYRDNLLRTIRHCHTLRKKGLEIELRLYDRLPGWKTIFSHDRLWLQHYSPTGPVENMPVYSFGRDPIEHSLYRPFMIEFNRQWERAEEVPLRKLSKTQLVNQFLNDDAPLPALHRCDFCEYKNQQTI